MHRQLRGPLTLRLLCIAAFAASSLPAARAEGESERCRALRTDYSARLRAFAADCGKDADCVWPRIEYNPSVPPFLIISKASAGKRASEIAAIKTFRDEVHKACRFVYPPSVAMWPTPGCEKSVCTDVGQFGHPRGGRAAAAAGGPLSSASSPASHPSAKEAVPAGAPAGAGGAPGHDDIRAWLKVKDDQYTAEMGTLLQKRTLRDAEGTARSQTRIEELCAEALDRTSDPKVRAAWFARRASVRSFVSGSHSGGDPRALEDIDSAIELDPDKAEYRETRARFRCPPTERCEGAAFEKAAADYEKASGLAPDEFRYPNRLGLLYQRGGFPDKAEHWLRVSLQRAKRPADRELVESNLKELLAAPQAP